MGAFAQLKALARQQRQNGLPVVDGFKDVLGEGVDAVLEDLGLQMHPVLRRAGDLEPGGDMLVELQVEGLRRGDLRLVQQVEDEMPAGFQVGMDVGEEEEEEIEDIGNEYTYEYLKPSHLLDIVDGYIMSFEVHQVKPYEGIYRSLLRKYNLISNECIFIDDNIKNIFTANKLGIHGVHVKMDNYDSIIEELKERNIIEGDLNDV